MYVHAQYITTVYMYIYLYIYLYVPKIAYLISLYITHTTDSLSKVSLHGSFPGNLSKVVMTYTDICVWLRWVYMELMALDAVTSVCI